MTDDRTPAEGPADDADTHAADAAGAPEALEATTHPTETQPTDELGPAAPAASAAPAPAEPAAPAVPDRVGASGWAVAALVVGIGAFLVGLVPVVGLLVALVGVALGVVALVRRRRAQPGLGLGVTGVVLSGVAAVTNVAVVAALVVAVPIGARLADEAAGAWSGWDHGQGLDGDPYGPGPGQGLDGAGDADGDDVADVSTACWSFSLPDDAWSSGGGDTDIGTDTCTTWLDVSGDVANTSVEVVTVPAAVGTGLVSPTSTDRVADAVSALRASWLPGIGTVVGEPEQSTLDGEPAALVRLATGPDLASPATVVVAWSPTDATGTSSLTLVTVRASADETTSASDAAPAGAAERTLTSLTTTWDWAGR
jgi:hypothetical protein